jgi:hypothetical protein
MEFVKLNKAHKSKSLKANEPTNPTQQNLTLSNQVKVKNNEKEKLTKWMDNNKCYIVLANFIHIHGA